MRFEQLPVSERATRINRGLEEATNRFLRTYDRVLGLAHLGGRKAPYDDEHYEFVGGASDTLRRKVYDKSLRLLWKAEKNAPYLSFKDASEVEKSLVASAEKSLSREESEVRAQLTLPEFKARLDAEYTPRQKQAIVNILTPIGHGEAYAWLVSAELLGSVKSTGARAALTMQVLEEAKHFVVLRELIQAFDVPVPRQSAWEYLFLERVLKADGLEKFFGMNILVEGIALSLFGVLGHLPGLEMLALFHLDEARHTGLPTNYFSEFPMGPWEKHNPRARLARLNMLLPALALIPHLEEDFAELGIDALEFGGSTLRKVAALVEKSGYPLPLPRPLLMGALNELFNLYGRATRTGHHHVDYLAAEVTRDPAQLEVERELFGAA
ncbi:MAG: hypothetical protein P1V51_23040 [Deltaproteobacteria bacterium]|nr:hypothetical protein [Deltaproteobacteria bacterium]